MAELCLMASHGYPPGVVFHPEQGLSRVPKDFQPLLSSVGTRQEMMRLGSLSLRPHESEPLWKSVIGLSEANHFVRIDSTTGKPVEPVVVDVQDTCPDPILFSFEDAEQCIRFKRLQFLMSRPSEVERDGLDLSMLSDLMALGALKTDLNQQPTIPIYGSFVHEAESHPSFVNRNSKFEMPLFDLVGNLTHNPQIMSQLDGQVTSEMRNILSVIAEFYLSKDSTKWRKQSVLVPNFTWSDISEARGNICGSSMMLETVEFAPMKSPDKIKLKPSPKRKTHKKSGRERDLHRRNHFHACESLLSIMMNKKRQGKTTILSLKNSGPELPQLLTQFSASIAGTGLAVLFSVVCKVACGRVPFCSSKLFSTSLGFGLVWLSWAVNKLGDTIVHISKNSSKKGLKEEEMMKKLDRSVNEIFFRAATLMAVAVLRLA